MRALAVVGVVAGVLVLAFGGIAFSAYRYEQARDNRILPGVTVAGMDVSGLTRSEAVAAVRGGSAVHLSSTMTITAAGKTWTVTPEQLGQRAAIGAAVDRALDLNRSMGMFSRFWHRFRGTSVDREIDRKSVV